MILKKNKPDEDINRQYVETIVEDLHRIYSNKSGDLYKCSGDITKSPVYSQFEEDIASLTTIKGYPQNDAASIKTMFNTLHRPIFKKMVTEYLAKPDERNITFTAVFTVGYNLLVSELMWIKVATVATDHGMVYKPGKVQGKERSSMVIIRKYNKDTEKKIDKLILTAQKERRVAGPVQEAATLDAIGAVANSVVGVVEAVFGVFGSIFKSASSLNPVALISAVLSRSYDKKVAMYEKISEEYEAAKKAYEEYKKIPPAQRKQRIEHRYPKMIEKYNIKMQNLKAKIDHYDLRANGEADDIKKKATKKTAAGTSSKPNTATAGSDDSSSKTDDDFDF